MNDNVLEALLMYCLDQFEAGVPAEEILAQYPEQAEAIRPLLTLAAQLSTLTPEPRPAAQTASQTLFLAHAQAMKEANRRVRAREGWWRPLTYALALVAILSVALLAASARTASALPGTTLYPVKRAAEDLRLNLANDPATWEQVRQEIDAERAWEIGVLLDRGWVETVECHCLVEEIGETLWQVCGLSVVVNEQTVIEGDPWVGGFVEVRGRTENGRFFADTIIVESEDETPTYTPHLTVTVTAVPPTPTLTATPIPPTSTLDREFEETAEPDDEETPEPEEDELEDEETPEPGDDNNSGSGSGGDNSGSSSGDDDDNSGSGSGGDNSGSGNGNDGDNSGSGSGDDDDNSGSGSGSGDDNSGSDSGSGDDDDNSGSGSGDDDDNSGSGSGSSGSGGGD